MALCGSDVQAAWSASVGGCCTALRILEASYQAREAGTRNSSDMKPGLLGAGGVFLLVSLNAGEKKKKRAKSSQRVVPALLKGTSGQCCRGDLACLGNSCLSAVLQDWDSAPHLSRQNAF